MDILQAVMTDPALLPKRPTRQSAAYEVPENIDEILKDAQRRTGINYVKYYGMYSVWGRNAHYVSQVCGMPLQYYEGYTCLVWPPEKHCFVAECVAAYMEVCDQFLVDC